VRQVRASGLLMGVSFQKPANAEEGEEHWWSARAARGKMLENGVWAICDKQDTIVCPDKSGMFSGVKSHQDRS
jgi:acetylornithine/succinyldiaminopimelate/putrescine aminotransferase